MANTSMSPKEVKSVCDGLECSPSQHQESSKAGGKASPTPGHRGGSHAGPSTSAFHEGKK